MATIPTNVNTDGADAQTLAVVTDKPSRKAPVPKPWPTVPKAPARTAAKRATKAVAEDPLSTEELERVQAFDFEGEKLALVHLLEVQAEGGQVDQEDPLHPRLLAYQENVRLLDKLQAHRKLRASAGAEVPTSEAVKARAIGTLRSEEDDKMTLHTMEAMRLFLGVSPDPSADNRYGVPGGRRAATALRQLFLMSAMDNPYADYALIYTDEKVSEIKALIDRTTKEFQGRLEDMKAKGLSYSVLQASDPQTVSLGYHSPYGYMMSTVIVNFDYLVRVIKSAERRDLATKSEVHEQLYRIKHRIRSMFEAAMKSQRVLMNENMKGMKRADFLPQQADESAAKRVAAAKQLLGELPTDVFIGAKTPRHSLRQERLPDAEKRLLMEAAESLNAATAAASKLGQPAGNLIE